MIFAYTRPRYQVSVYRTISPLVSKWFLFAKSICSSGYFPFNFEDGTLVMIASDPGNG